MGVEEVFKQEINQEKIREEEREIAEIAEELKDDGMRAGDELYMKAREIYRQRKELEKRVN